MEMRYCVCNIVLTPSKLQTQPLKQMSSPEELTERHRKASVKNSAKLEHTLDLWLVGRLWSAEEKEK